MKRIIAVLAMVAAPALADESGTGIPIGGWGHTTECLDESGKGTSCQMEPSNWHLLTRSHDGKISLVKGLTKKECDKLVLILTPVYPGNCSGCIVTETDTTIVSAECFQ